MATNLQDQPESTIGHKPEELRSDGKKPAAEPPPARPLPHGGAAPRAEEGDETELGSELREVDRPQEEPDLAVDPDEEPPFVNEPEKPPHPWT